MKIITLTRDKVALIDDEDFSLVTRYTWRAVSMGNMWYAHSGDSRDGDFVTMHQLIFGDLPGFEIDHKDRDGLNNQRYNLRHATHAQNNANKPAQSNNNSGYKGVSWHRKARKWMAQLNVNGQHFYLGLHDTPKQAALVYNQKAKELLGDFAYLNNV